MQTEGLRASLSPAQIRRSLSSHDRAFARCFYDFAERLPPLGGAIRLHFRVDQEGRVASVHPSDSTLGHRELERCLLETAVTVEFPTPRGSGDVDFSWPLELMPPEGVQIAATLEPDTVAELVETRREAVREACIPDDSGWRFQVTAYVSPEGRVVAAGAAMSDPAAAEQVDCVVEAIRQWRLPPRGRLAKLTFDLQ